MNSLSFKYGQKDVSHSLNSYLSYKINHKTDFDINIKSLSEVIAEELNIDRVGLWLFDDSKKNTHCHNLYERNTNLHSRIESIAISTFPNYLKTLLENKTINCSHPDQDPTYYDFWTRYLKSRDIKSIINSTLWIDGEIAGILTGATKNVRYFSERDINYFSTAADIVTNGLYQLERTNFSPYKEKHFHLKNLMREFFHLCSNASFMSFQDCVIQTIQTVQNITHANNVTLIMLNENIIKTFCSNSKSISLDYDFGVKTYTLLKNTEFLWIADTKTPLAGTPDHLLSIYNQLSGSSLLVPFGTSNCKRKNIPYGFIIYEIEPEEDNHFNQNLLDLSYYTTEAINIISEYIQTQSLYRESLEISRATFDNSTVGMTLINQEGHILRANTSAKKILDIKGKLLKTSSIYDFFSEQKVKSAIKKCLLRYDSTAFQEETQIITPKGENKSIILHVSPIMLGDAYRTYAVIQLIDITDKINALEELNSQKTFFKLVIDASPNFIFAKDIDGTFILANKAVSEAYGCTGEELIGKKDSDFNDNPSEVDKFISDDRYVIETGNELVIPDEEVTDSKNKIRILSTIKKPLRCPNTQKTYALGVSSDVTDRKKAEQEYKEWLHNLEHAQKLESLGLLASGIAHDFNNILQGVIGNTSLAKELIREENAKALVEKALNSAEKAAEITNQLLSYSGKAHQELKLVDFNQAVKETSELVERMTKKKANLSFNIQSESLPILADLPKIRQVILNLITNAIEAIDKKEGLIKITTRITKIQEIETKFSLSNINPNLNFATFIVEDNGTGISDENLQRIYEPFFSTKVTGRGIGLAAVQGIISSHNGLLDIKTKLGVGTTFTVHLPLENASLIDNNLALSDEVNVNDHEKLFQNKTVLLIDDEDIAREVCKAMLEHISFNTLSATNGLQGYESFLKNKENISAIILDLTMPKMDGLDVLRKVREVSPNLPIIISSGYSANQIPSELVFSYNTVFLQKPYTMNQFKEALNTIFKSIV